MTVEKEGFKQLLYTRRLKDLIFSSNRIREKWEIILTRESSYRRGESFTTVCKLMLNPGKLVSSGLERSLSLSARISNRARGNSANRKAVGNGRVSRSILEAGEMGEITMAGQLSPR